MWLDLVLLFWFCAFTCTAQLLFRSLLERLGGEGVGCLKLDVQGQEYEKILDVDEQKG